MMRTFRLLHPAMVTIRATFLALILIAFAPAPSALLASAG